MKRLTRTVFGFLACLYLAGCTKSAAPQSEINLKQAQGLTRIILAGNLDSLAVYMDSDAINHSGMRGDAVGLTNIKADLEMIHRISADLKVEVIREMADDEYVFQWLKFRGVAKTDVRGDVGSEFESVTIQALRFKNGKVVEHWEYRDPRDIIKMMGSGGKAKADSTTATKN